MVVVRGLDFGFRGRVMRVLLALVFGGVLASCAAPVPDSGTRGESYNDYLQRREAELRGGNDAGTLIVPPRAPAEAQVDASTFDPFGSGIASSGGAGIGGERPRGDAPTNIAVQSGEMTAIRNGGISDEQSFEAVSERETIESDRERLERLRSQYEVIAPTALPTRSGNSGPNIVEYALATTNRVGEVIYRRVNPLRESASVRNCAAFPSPDLAQVDFLSRGGPERDGRSLDPDGDGFACGWDPVPFRSAVRR